MKSNSVRRTRNAVCNKGRAKHLQKTAALLRVRRRVPELQFEQGSFGPSSATATTALPPHETSNESMFDEVFDLKQPIGFADLVSFANIGLGAFSVLKMQFDPEASCDALVLDSDWDANPPNSPLDDTTFHCDIDFLDSNEVPSCEESPSSSQVACFLFGDASCEHAWRESEEGVNTVWTEVA